MPVKFHSPLLLFPAALCLCLLLGGCVELVARQSPDSLKRLGQLRQDLTGLYALITQDPLPQDKVEAVRQEINGLLAHELARGADKNAGSIKIVQNLQASFEEQMQDRAKEAWSQQVEELFKANLLAMLDDAQKNENQKKPCFWSCLCN